MNLKRIGATVSEVLPELVAEYPKYGSKDCEKPFTLKELYQNMHEAMKELNLPDLLCNACKDIPKTVFSSAETYQKLIRNRTEKVKVEEVAKRISGHLVVPYSPGIPILMPGERFGKKKESLQIQFLLSLQEFSRRFPGFGHEIHGIEVDVFSGCAV